MSAREKVAGAGWKSSVVAGVSHGCTGTERARATRPYAQLARIRSIAALQRKLHCSWLASRRNARATARNFQSRIGRRSTRARDFRRLIAAPNIWPRIFLFIRFPFYFVLCSVLYART